MDYQIAKIHQDPAGIGLALSVEQGVPRLLESLRHSLPYGLDLTFGLGRDEDEGIRIRAETADVKEEDVESLIVLGYVHGTTRRVQGFTGLGVCPRSLRHQSHSTAALGPHQCDVLDAAAHYRSSSLMRRP